jgi:hypothetical protein
LSGNEAMNFKAAREADPTLVLQGVFELPRVYGEKTSRSQSPPNKF